MLNQMQLNHDSMVVFQHKFHCNVSAKEMRRLRRDGKVMEEATKNRGNTASGGNQES